MFKIVHIREWELLTNIVIVSFFFVTGFTTQCCAVDNPKKETIFFVIYFSVIWALISKIDLYKLFYEIEKKWLMNVFSI